MMSLAKAVELLAQARKKIKVLEKHNQPVFVRNLIVRQGTRLDDGSINCYGENTSHTNPYYQPVIERLYAHINFLLKLANEEHRNKYCEKFDEEYQIKNGKENNITQLNTPEFSFYTPFPLEIEQFQKLIREIEEMAETLEPNVHIFLSSFAIIHQNTIFNISLFIEGGKQPVIRPFIKKTVGEGDLSYGLKVFYDQKNTEKNLSADFICLADNLTLSLNSVFEATTFGGIPYTIVTDICSDNYHNKGVKTLLDRLHKENPSTLIKPNKTEHCIISNTLAPVLTKSNITFSYFHFDPNYPLSDTYGFNLDEPTLEDNIKEDLIPEDFDKMAIDEDELGYRIEYPPYGSQIIIEILEEEKIVACQPKIKNKIDKHNNKILNERYPLSFYREVNKHGKLTSLSQKEINIKYLMPGL